MRGKLGQYRYDFLRGAFMPLDGEPLAQAERDTAGLVEGLVAAIEHIYTQLGVAPHPKAKKALADWRRTVDAQRKG
jgi:hypothetical protein